MADVIVAAPAAAFSHREKDNDYLRVITRLNANWRVIECVDQIQWIVQKASPSEWRSVSYCDTKEGLFASVRRLCGAVDAASQEVLDALPVRCKRSRP